MTIALGLAGWFVGSVFAAVLFGRAIPHTDRDCDSEEAEREPVGETGRISFFHVVGDTDV